MFAKQVESIALGEDGIHRHFHKLSTHVFSILGTRKIRSYSYQPALGVQLGFRQYADNTSSYCRPISTR